MIVRAVLLALLLLAGPAAAAVPDAASVRLQTGLRVPLRDGVDLGATAYLPKSPGAPGPCLLTLTPYTAQSYHSFAVYFAAHGFAHVVVDSRGRGDSGGVFRPMIQEANDGYDVVEWLARQPFCNGKVGMWGGSYTGYDQWATAKERPPHLATIVPAASSHAGIDFPARSNISYPFLLQWLTYVGGHTLQSEVMEDSAFWAGLWRDRFERGAAFATLGTEVGPAPPMLAEWLAHPEVDAYFDAYSPTPAQYAALDIPILTITGSYDDDQPGALAYYRDFMRDASPAERARHFLVIGPWDHAGTHTPTLAAGGVTFGPAALVDLNAFHLDWYRWTMAGGDRPAFLAGPVVYYVAGADRWRTAATLDAVTAEARPLYLGSTGDATHVFASGTLTAGAAAGTAKTDAYVYDPRDVSRAALEASVDPASKVDQSLVFASDGRQLVYHSAPFPAATEIAGTFRLSAWLAIDRPDTDFLATVYEIDPDGHSIWLSSDQLRARYRTSLRHAELVTTRAPLRYDFARFTFVARRVAAGSRLRVVIGPINSIYTEKNYNSGKPVATETMADARAVTVTLVHDAAHPSTLVVPIGQPE